MSCQDGNIKEYKPLLKSLAEFMAKKGYTSKPFPSIHFYLEPQKGPFAPTGNYDPSNKIINLYVGDRHIKDVLRSFAHELIHHQQNMEGRLGEGAYSGNEIINDKKLQKLEAEAYLKGNMIFRSWTEVEKNKK